MLPVLLMHDVELVPRPDNHAHRDDAEHEDEEDDAKGHNPQHLRFGARICEVATEDDTDNEHHEEHDAQDDFMMVHIKLISHALTLYLLYCTSRRCFL